MQKIIKVVLFTSSVFLASCGAKSDDSNNTLTEKKAKLDFLQDLKMKKQTATMEQMSEQEIDAQIEMLKSEA